MQEPKPGYETTEFWFAIITGVIGVLVAAGVITPAQASEATAQATTWAGVMMTLVAAVSYITSRVFVKHSAYKAAAQIQSAQASATPPAAAAPDPAAGLIDTPAAPRYGAANASNPPIRVPSTVSFVDPSTATHASSL